MSQIIEDVRCAGCNKKVFASVTLAEDKTSPIPRCSTSIVESTRLKPDSPQKCLDGENHRVNLWDII